LARALPTNNTEYTTSNIDNNTDTELEGEPQVEIEIVNDARALPRAYSADEFFRKAHSEAADPLYTSERRIDMYLRNGRSTLNIRSLPPSIHRHVADIYRSALPILQQMFSHVDRTEVYRLALEVWVRLREDPKGRRRIRKLTYPDDYAHIVCYIYARRRSRLYPVPRHIAKRFLIRFSDLYPRNDVDSTVINELSRVAENDFELFRAAVICYHWSRRRLNRGLAAKTYVILSLRLATAITGRLKEHRIKDITKRLGLNRDAAGPNIWKYIYELDISKIEGASGSFRAFYVPRDLCELLESNEVRIASYVRCV